MANHRTLINKDDDENGKYDASIVGDDEDYDDGVVLQGEDDSAHETAQQSSDRPDYSKQRLMHSRSS